MHFSRNLKEQVADALAIRIMKGMYQPGQILPREVDLTIELDISRTILREALGVLSAKGLTETRTRRGTSVRPKAEWNLLDPDVLNWQRTVSSKSQFLADLNEVRGIVEPNASALAAERATKEQIDVLEGCLETMRHFETDREAAKIADRNFHTGILIASGNPFLMAMSAPVIGALDESIGTSFSALNFFNALPMHAAILSAIKDRDPQKARCASEALLINTVSDLASALKD